MTSASQRENRKLESWNGIEITQIARINGFRDFVVHELNESDQGHYELQRPELLNRLNHAAVRLAISDQSPIVHRSVRLVAGGLT